MTNSRYGFFEGLAHLLSSLDLYTLYNKSWMSANFSWKNKMITFLMVVWMSFQNCLGSSYPQLNSINNTCTQVSPFWNSSWCPNLYFTISKSLVSYSDAKNLLTWRKPSMVKVHKTFILYPKSILCIKNIGRIYKRHCLYE